MENPNATSNDFSTRIIQKDVSFQVSSSFLNHEEQTKSQMATLGQDMKNVPLELREHRVNAVEGNPRTVTQTKKEDRMQHYFATTAAEMDKLHVDVARRCETKNWKESRTRELLRKRSGLLKTTT